MLDVSQPNLFDASVKQAQPKRVEETSRERYHEMRETGELANRERIVLRGLARYIVRYGEHPTAYELFEYTQSCGEATDLNSTRPRLTGLRQKRLVDVGEKRKCAVTRKNALTWHVTDKGRTALEVMK